MQPGKLLLQAAGVCDFDPEHLLDVFGQQRQRFVAVLRGFGPDDWAAPTRCTDWSAHDVVRHRRPRPCRQKRPRGPLLVVFGS